ncbi:gibberellin 20 oxidase 1-A-like [Iris pallida]|uniref:Gibberellin 20 oxidase 1-A-like n=1 Tax=Iris pallida TaxID=29817 RepID=A0AAX6H7X3_IRIPA|nr:gibberellin 20 oxidase 1-A-like [Iris pallida]KAJ6836943.1 gibberellin 20 oxidase 1-A-like [Iris pallida]
MVLCHLGSAKIKPADVVAVAAKPMEGSQPLVFDAAVLSHQAEIPAQFIWPEEDKPRPDAYEELNVPLIDLKGFLSGDPVSAAEVTRLVGEACESHGFFQVINHGVDPCLLAESHRCVQSFFSMPLGEKQRAQRKPGESCGYTSSFTGRFANKLPWKETLSFRFPSSSSMDVLDYFIQTLGEDFRYFGKVYQDYCEGMSNLSLAIMEVLGMSLGVDRSHFREFFDGNDSIMRLNYYPPCQKPDHTLGTGPHCDPTSLTILHQDDVGGLQVFTDGRWRTITPKTDAFVINIGDTFMASTTQHILFILICSVEWAIQELPPQGGGEQQDGEEVAGLLPVPACGQGGSATGGACRLQPPEGLPGLHLADSARFHAEALQSGHEDTGRLLQMDFGGPSMNGSI